MTALDFPTSPSNGDLYSNYIYDGTRGVWNVNVQGVASRFFVSDEPPATATNGDAWFDTSEGVTYIYYVDTDSSQWVESGNPVLSFNTVENLSDTTITSPTEGQALTYDSATSKWINETPATTLDGLTDTNIYDPGTGQVLSYDGSEWINDTIVIPEPLSPFLLGGM